MAGQAAFDAVMSFSKCTPSPRSRKREISDVEGCTPSPPSAGPKLRLKWSLTDGSSCSEPTNAAALPTAKPFSSGFWGQPPSHAQAFPPQPAGLQTHQQEEVFECRGSHVHHQAKTSQGASSVDVAMKKPAETPSEAHHACCPQPELQPLQQEDALEGWGSHAHHEASTFQQAFSTGIAVKEPAATSAEAQGSCPQPELQSLQQEDAFEGLGSHVHHEAPTFQQASSKGVAVTEAAKTFPEAHASCLQPDPQSLQRKDVLEGQGSHVHHESLTFQGAFSTGKAVEESAVNCADDEAKQAPSATWPTKTSGGPEAENIAACQELHPCETEVAPMPAEEAKVGLPAANLEAVDTLLQSEIHLPLMPQQVDQPEQLTPGACDAAANGEEGQQAGARDHSAFVGNASADFDQPGHLDEAQLIFLPGCGTTVEGHLHTYAWSADEAENQPHLASVLSSKVMAWLVPLVEQHIQNHSDQCLSNQLTCVRPIKELLCMKPTTMDDAIIALLKQTEPDTFPSTSPKIDCGGWLLGCKVETRVGGAGCCTISVREYRSRSAAARMLGSWSFNLQDGPPAWQPLIFTMALRGMMKLMYQRDFHVQSDLVKLTINEIKRELKGSLGIGAS